MTFSKKLLSFIKKEPILIISGILALIAICIFKENITLTFLTEKIDFRTLSILFCLMIVVKAFQSKNLLDWAAYGLLKFCRNERILYFVLTFFVFFISMLVTNDVALLTFVPLTILICSKSKIKCGTLIILETIAANLGSCFTPMGNPQNLYLFSYYEFSTGLFFLNTALITIPSILFITGLIFICSKKTELNVALLQNSNSSQETLEISSQTDKSKLILDWKFFIYCADFILCLLTVFHIVPFYISLSATIGLMLICDFKLFAKVDYFLLLTFIFLFIFTGCLSSLEKFSAFLNKVLTSGLNTYLTGIISSQFISNVPAAILLSGFTSNGSELLLGVNVGGLGTLIASMASVISFKLYNASEEAQTPSGKKYFAVFTGMNFTLLILLAAVVWGLEFLIFYLN